MIGLTPRGAYFGPNPLSSDPVIVVDVALDGVASQARTVIARMIEFNARWLDPIERDRFADPAEDLADYLVKWSLAALNYDHGALRAAGHRRLGANVFRVWLGHHLPGLSLSALELAAAQGQALLAGNADVRDLSSRINAVWQGCEDRHPDVLARILMDAAGPRDIPWMHAWNLGKHWQFGWGARGEVYFLGGSNAEGMVTSQVVRDKKYAKAAMQRLGYPTPADCAITAEEEIPAAIAKIGFPCVVKPNDLGAGAGVSVGLTTEEQVRAAFRLARGYSSAEILVEQCVPGDDHRLMIVGGRMVGAFRRDLPTVTGDGARTLRALVERLNHGRILPGKSSLTRFKRIAFDHFVVEHLATQGLTPDSIPEAGRKVTLRGNSNVATGGGAVDVTDTVHPLIRFGAEALARAMGLQVTGFDYLTTDISRTWDEVPGAYIELNMTPSLDVMTLAGWDAVTVGNLALGPELGRIPVWCIVVPDDAFAAAERRFAELALPENAGWATHDKAQVGPLTLKVTPNNGWAGVESLLSHTVVERAFLLLASGQLQRRGFPLDRVDGVWSCDPDLPGDWAGVLDGVSAAPVVTGEWQAGMAAMPLA